MKLLDKETMDEAAMFAAKGIEYWFRFNQTVGKSDLLNEDAIKYPLVEYLIADGDDCTSSKQISPIRSNSICVVYQS